MLYDKIKSNQIIRRKSFYFVPIRFGGRTGQDRTDVLTPATAVHSLSTSHYAHRLTPTASEIPTQFPARI